MNRLTGVRGRTPPPGVYRLRSRYPTARLLKPMKRWGWHVGCIDGMMIKDKESFLTEVGQALAFPDYSGGRGFGRNWDAFEEMINDLSWLPAAGYVLLIEHADRFFAAQPGLWQTALAILRSACAGWRARGVPFYVLLRHDGDHSWERSWRPFPSIATREERIV